MLLRLLIVMAIIKTVLVISNDTTYQTQYETTALTYRAVMTDSLTSPSASQVPPLLISSASTTTTTTIAAPEAATTASSTTTTTTMTPTLSSSLSPSPSLSPSSSTTTTTTTASTTTSSTTSTTTTSTTSTTTTPSPTTAATSATPVASKPMGDPISIAVVAAIVSGFGMLLLLTLLFVSVALTIRYSTKTEARLLMTPGKDAAFYTGQPQSAQALVASMSIQSFSSSPSDIHLEGKGSQVHQPGVYYNRGFDADSSNPGTSHPPSGRYEREDTYKPIQISAGKSGGGHSKA